MNALKVMKRIELVTFLRPSVADLPPRLPRRRSISAPASRQLQPRPPCPRIICLQKRFSHGKAAAGEWNSSWFAGTSSRSLPVGRAEEEEEPAPSTAGPKQISALSTKRPVRKKNLAKAENGADTQKVIAYAIAEEIYLEKLKVVMEDNGLYSPFSLPLDVVDAIYLKAKYQVDCKPRHMLLFREGAAIFWNMPETERKEVLKFIRKHSDTPYDVELAMNEKESLDYIHTRTATSFNDGKIHLKETDSDDGQQEILEKYTFSNALCLSVKLAVWEILLDKFVDTIEPVTEDLRDGKKIKMSRQEVLRKTGELFALRHLINLSSDLLDTPDFYWDREGLEPLYQKTCNHLNISRRTKVMNQKLKHCCELTELLSSHLNDRHHVRLEWMIIILIMVEIVFEIIHYAEKYSS